MKNLLRPTALFAALLLLFVSMAGHGAEAQGKKAAAASANTGKIEKGAGSKNAPIVMEVWSDFQCPACRTLFLTTLRQLKQEYVNSGKVYLVHRDMPLSGHQHAREAARYVNAAAKLGKFEAVAEAVYTYQDQWSVNGSVGNVVATVLTPAEMRRLTAVLRTPEIDQAIDADMAAGRDAQVQSTPTSLIRHKGKTTPLTGVIAYPLLKRYLDQLLSK